MKEIMIALMMVLTLGACAHSDVVTTKASAAADAALKSAIFATCTMPTRGAVKRKWPTEDGRERHNEFCKGEGQ